MLDGTPNIMPDDLKAWRRTHHQPQLEGAVWLSLFALLVAGLKWAITGHDDDRVLVYICVGIAAVFALLYGAECWRRDRRPLSETEMNDLRMAIKLRHGQCGPPGAY